MNNLKKHKIWVFAGIIILVVFSGAVAYMKLMAKPAAQRFASCSDHAYISINNGMSESDVTALLGAPASKRVKSSPDQNFFSQGEKEASIAEGWILICQDTSRRRFTLIGLAA